MKKVFLIFLTFVSLYAINGLEYINSLRAKVGLNPLSSNTSLKRASQNHTIFMVKNNVVSHYESQEYPYFSGKTPSDRAIYAGFKSNFIIENLSFGQTNIKESIDNLFSAIYHRLGFLNNNINEIGIANLKDFYNYDMGNSYLNTLCSSNGFNGYGKSYYDVCANKQLKIKANVYDNAKNILKSNNPKIIIWPPKEGTSIPPVFYEEEPDPLPHHNMSGYPISVSFNDYFYHKVPKLYSFKIFDKNGYELYPTKILTYKNDPNQKLSKYDFVLFPLKRLHWNETYTIEFKYILDNKVYNILWSFSTQKLKQKYITITKSKQTFNVNSNKTYILYFPNHIIKRYNVKYTQGLKIKSSSIDANTLKIKLIGKIGNYAEFRINNKTIKMIIR